MSSIELKQNRNIHAGHDLRHILDKPAICLGDLKRADAQKPLECEVVCDDNLKIPSMLLAKTTACLIGGELAQGGIRGLDSARNLAECPGDRDVGADLAHPSLLGQGSRHWC